MRLDQIWEFCWENGEKIKNFVDIFGTMGTVTLGILAVNAWHRQLRCSTAFDIGKRLKLSVYEFRECVRIARRDIAPIVFLPQLPPPPISNFVHQAYAQALTQEQAYMTDQMIKAQGCYLKFKNVVHEVEAFCSEDMERHRADLREVYGNWIAALQKRIELSRDVIQSQDYNKLTFVEPELVDQSEDARSMAFNDALNAAIEKIECFVRKFLK